MSTLPTNPIFVCFTISVLRDRTWTKQGHRHNPQASYKFFTYNEADAWARNNLVEDFFYEVTQETLIYNPITGNWE